MLSEPQGPSGCGPGSAERPFAGAVPGAEFGSTLGPRPRPRARGLSRRGPAGAAPGHPGRRAWMLCRRRCPVLDGAVLRRSRRRRARGPSPAQGRPRAPQHSARPGQGRGLSKGPRRAGSGFAQGGRAAAPPPKARAHKGTGRAGQHRPSPGARRALGTGSVPRHQRRSGPDGSSLAARPGEGCA